MTIPLTLADWTLEAVKELVEQGALETERFDFKEMVSPRDPEAKERLPRTCAAFANSGGGFVVFGDADQRGRLEDRLVGIEPTSDFAEQFGAQARRCQPAVYWEPRNPPLLLPTGRPIHVAHVPKSWAGPHAVRSRDGGWVFPKRTNQGNAEMDYSEIRAMFVGMEEKRARLRLLDQELRRLEMVTSARLLPENRQAVSVAGPLISVSLVEMIVADAYPLIQTNRDLVSALEFIRAEVHAINHNAAITSDGCLDPRAVIEPLRFQLRHHCEDARRSLAGLIA